MNVNIKYLKDEVGNIISPVTSNESVFTNDGYTLSQCMNGSILFEGDSTQDITLSDNWTNYDKTLISYHYTGIYGYVLIKQLINPVQVSLSISFSITPYRLARVTYKTIKLQDNKITRSGSGYLCISENKVIDANIDENSIYINKVIGYKN